MTEFTGKTSSAAFKHAKPFLLLEFSLFRVTERVHWSTRMLVISGDGDGRGLDVQDKKPGGGGGGDVDRAKKRVFLAVVANAERGVCKTTGNTKFRCHLRSRFKSGRVSFAENPPILTRSSRENQGNFTPSFIPQVEVVPLLAIALCFDCCSRTILQFLRPPKDRSQPTDDCRTVKSNRPPRIQRG